MITVVELPSYIKKANVCLTTDNQKSLVDYLAVYPEAGAIMEGTGGIRKLRWATENSGKSGGVRVIYYYYNESIPLYLIAMFKKSEKANLTKAERNDLAAMVELLKKGARK
ncbi:type II toxin-antitoxin system RelE/ParE family toxin [Cysteiniphilum sp. 6C5]|uniref:type II toxin-antitoxin system RelE/ParE family toxin n=1 Tax=unclassified Cysteiniphilum TaxID=2610889 RepID=UPI003F82841F